MIIPETLNEYEENDIYNAIDQSKLEWYNKNRSRVSGLSVRI